MSEYDIAAIRARRVWDSRGRPTVEAEIRLEGGALGRAIAPAGASTGSHEAVDLRDGGPFLGGMDVSRAIAAVHERLVPALAGIDAREQAAVDAAIDDLDRTPRRSELGGNATIAVSMAVAWAAAQAKAVPLWEHLASLPGLAHESHDPSDARPVLLPLPEIQIFGGGKHAAGRVDIQDFMLVCPAAASFEEALFWTADVYREAGALMAEKGRLQGVADEGGYWPVFDDNEQALAMLTAAIERAGRRPVEEVGIALDIAASSFGSGGVYTLGLEKRRLDTGAMIDLVIGWSERYPVMSVEDPLAEDDIEGFVAFSTRAAGHLQIVGDDLLVTNAARVAEAARMGACNTVLIKPNQCGTLTGALEAWNAARTSGMSGIVSARSGETEDVTIVHLAVGWSVPQLKVGSFSRSERMAKWNEGLRIEEALGKRARLGAIGTRMDRSRLAGC